MARIRTVILYERNKIRPETLLAIAESKDGALIPVEASELNAFMPLNIVIPDKDPVVAAAAAKRNRKREEARAREAEKEEAQERLRA
jgi:hypothetical protein